MELELRPKRDKAMICGIIGCQHFSKSLIFHCLQPGNITFPCVPKLEPKLLKHLLPSANEVWGKVMFLHLSVCSRGGGCIQGWVLHPRGLGRLPPPRWILRDTVNELAVRMHSCSKLQRHKERTFQKLIDHV